MSKFLLQFDPDLAAQYGLEGAVLLGFLTQQSLLTGGRVQTNLNALQRLFHFLDEAQLLQIMERLMAQEALRFELQGRLLQIELITDQRPAQSQLQTQVEGPVEVQPKSQIESRDPQPSASVARMPTKSRLAPTRSIKARPNRMAQGTEVQQLPVVNEPVAMPKAAGPAPSFGRRSAWRQPSELDDIFEAAEQRRKQLREMDLNWRPSQTFFELLGRTRIDANFAEQCIDEFIAYYVERGKAESNWDQRFLSWVKRAWPAEESKRAGGSEQQTGARYETSRQDTRTARKRVTQAVMDVKNTDW